MNRTVTQGQDRTGIGARCHQPPLPPSKLELVSTRHSMPHCILQPALHGFLWWLLCALTTKTAKQPQALYCTRLRYLRTAPACTALLLACVQPPVAAVLDEVVVGVGVGRAVEEDAGVGVGLLAAQVAAP